MLINLGLSAHVAMVGLENGLEDDSPQKAPVIEGADECTEVRCQK